MIPLNEELDFISERQTAYFGLAAALHLMLFVWNPVVFKGIWKAIAVPKSEIVILDVGRMEAALSPRKAAVPARPVSSGIHPLRTPRPFHFLRTPVLPPAINQELSGNPTAAPITLNKGETLSVPVTHGPAWISRERTIPAGAALVSRELPVQGFSAGLERSIPETIHTTIPSSAKGVSIEGPLASRAVIHRVIPEYPAWAEEQGIGGTVRLYFSVASDGHVLSTLRIDRTSGNAELDKLAMEALRQWRFAQVAAEGTQWGIITFTFSLGNISN